MSNKVLIDRISRLGGLGSLTTSTASAFRGFNHQAIGNPIKMNTDNHGFTFFTRPCLNLSYDNIAQTRLLSSLLTNANVVLGNGKTIPNTLTLARAIRVLLDPWGETGIGSTSEHILNSMERTYSKLVDPRSPFMPVLSNNLLTLSGWPDPNTDTYVSAEGWAKQQWAIADDFPVDYRSFSLTANFRNIEGDPINALFQVWRQYMLRVLSGDMTPYPEMIAENEIDYMTRIYRFVMDPTRRFIQKWSACGAAFPTSNTLGASFNFSSDQFTDQSNSQISIPFLCLGAEYNDPITLHEFNRLVEMFNPAMSDNNRLSDNGSMKRLAPNEVTLFNYEGYPYVGDDGELEWWVDTDTYEAVMRDNGLLTNIQTPEARERTAV
jgi:hypothetical protein